MSISLADLRTKARQIAQDSPSTGGTGVQLLLNDPGDYDLAISQALDVLDGDRPNLRTLDVTVATAGSQFVLYGTGAVLPTSGLNGWVDGASAVQDIWFPYLASTQPNNPLERNDWRILEGPAGAQILEFLWDQPAVGQVIRFQYVNPHVIGATAGDTSIRAGDVNAVALLAASFILLMAAVKAAQNTGNTGLPNDVVDRRTQADVFRSMSKELRDRYAVIMGRGGSSELLGASGTKDLDVMGSFRPFLWHSSRGVR